MTQWYRDETKKAPKREDAELEWLKRQPTGSLDTLHRLIKQVRHERETKKSK